MKVSVQVVIEANGNAPLVVHEVTQLERDALQSDTLGLKLAEAKGLLQATQRVLVEEQVKAALERQVACSGCGAQRRPGTRARSWCARCWAGCACAARAGTTCVSYPAPAWQDFLELGVGEIIRYGEGSLQVSRRLRALLDGLTAVVPDYRKEAVEKQLGLLNKSVDRAFADPFERQVAATADRAGVGSHGSRPTQ